jgi:hypothetical protein
MFLSRRSRLRVVSIAILLLLACQSVGIAHGRTLTASGPANEPVMHSCHDLGSSKDGNEGTHEARCQSKHAFFTPSGADVLALDSLPSIIVRIERLATNSAVTLLAQSRPVHIEPPPLRILHCCLRN